MTLVRFLIFFSLFVILNVYLFVRGWQALPGRWTHIVYTVVFLVASTSVFLAIFLGNRLPLWLSHFLEIVGGYWIILFVFILAATFLADILRMADKWLGFFPQWISGNYREVKLGYFISVIVLLTLISVFGYIRFNNPIITRLNISTDNVKGKVHLVVASDFHLGNIIRKGRLGRWVDTINNLKPDIILITGDLFDHNMQSVELQAMDQELAQLHAPYGVFAIPGNHDYYAGIDSAIRYMRKSGIRVLRDDTVTIAGKLAIVGRDDYTNPNRKALQSLVNGLKRELPIVVLDHQPRSFSESQENQIDLHISGHTHDGQIFPFNYIVSKIYELGYGYKKAGKTHYYVSSGLGLWGAPIRLGTRSEIVSIVLEVDSDGS